MYTYMYTRYSVTYLHVHVDTIGTDLSVSLYTKATFETPESVLADYRGVLIIEGSLLERGPDYRGH